MTTSAEQNAQRQCNTQRKRQSGQEIEYPVDGLIGHKHILYAITEFCKAFLTLQAQLSNQRCPPKKSSNRPIAEPPIAGRERLFHRLSSLGRKAMFLRTIPLPFCGEIIVEREINLWPRRFPELMKLRGGR